ncbi:GbsR/MarR family transcriptional regulator [Emticicia sp. 17c]|uniref:GbsR/MarR family transcriptional regulator n=1 Tax=Emticicia sp. 17c TaxID=3127704 RepID=UPI00301C68CB
MNIEEIRQQFVQAWGVLGTSWGISRSMAQVHALLLLSKNEMSTEEIMEDLKLSRGNVNMVLRELISWNLLYKQTKPGDRKEYFIAEHDIWQIAVRIITERKKREIMPARQTVKVLLANASDANDAEQKHIKQMLGDLNSFIEQMDTLSELLLKAEKNALLKNVLKLMS